MYATPHTHTYNFKPGLPVVPTCLCYVHNTSSVFDLLVAVNRNYSSHHCSYIPLPEEGKLDLFST